MNTLAYGVSIRMILTRSALPDIIHGQQKGKTKQEIHPRTPFRGVSLCVPGTRRPIGASRRGTCARHRNPGSIILIDRHIRPKGQPYVERLRPTSGVRLQSADSRPWMGLFLAAPIQPLKSVSASAPFQFLLLAALTSMSQYQAFLCTV